MALKLDGATELSQCHRDNFFCLLPKRDYLLLCDTVMAPVCIVSLEMRQRYEVQVVTWDDVSGTTQTPAISPFLDSISDLS